MLTPKNPSNNSQYQRLIYDIRNNNITNIRLWLEESESDVNEILDPTYKLVALHYANNYNRIEIVRLLLNQAQINPNQQDKKGWTPLHYTTDATIAELLLNHTKIEPNEQNVKGWTPLHSAISSGHIIIVKLLIQHPRINLHVKNSDGQTALDFVNFYINYLIEEHEEIKQFNDNRTKETFQEKIYQTYTKIREMIENRLNEQEQYHILNPKNIPLDDIEVKKSFTNFCMERKECEKHCL